MPPCHTVDYSPLLKSQLAQGKLTFRPFLLQLWSRTTWILGVSQYSQSTEWAGLLGAPAPVMLGTLQFKINSRGLDMTARFCQYCSSNFHKQAEPLALRYRELATAESREKGVLCHQEVDSHFVSARIHEVLSCTLNPEP